MEYAPEGPPTAGTPAVNAHAPAVDAPAPAADAPAPAVDASAPAGAPLSLADWAKQVRVAVGLTHLAPISAADTARGVRLRFEAPSPLPAGLQIIFLAFGPDDRLEQPRSDYRLHAIRWR